MAEVGSAFVSILPSAKGFGGKLDGQIGGDLEKSGQSAGKRWGAGFKKVVAGGLALGALAGASLIKGSLDEAREAQKVGALTTAVIKSTGGAAGVTAKHVDDLASSISKKTGIDDEQIASGQNLLLTFKNIKREGGVYDAATRSTVDMAAAMAAASGGSINLRSASTMMGKALNDPVKGLTALSRVGVQFTKSQQDSIKKMVASGNTMGAQKAILKELNAQFGGAAASQATAADKAGVAWGNLKEEMGTKLLPVADKLSNWATDDLIPALSSSVGFIDRNKGAIAALAGAIGAGMLAAKAYTITTTIMASIQAAQAVAAGTATTAQIGLNTAMKANIIGLVVTALVALVAGFMYAYRNSEKFRNGVNGLWATCRKVFAFIVDKWLWTAGLLVKGAAKAFGWVPGIGPKLKSAAAKFDSFRDQVNRSLGGIHDKNINVNVKAHMPKVLSDKGIKDWQVFGGARAAGGPVRSGSAYLVGENGPELFTARQSGRIVPNHELSAGAGSGVGLAGTRLYLVLDNGQTLGAYVDTRADNVVSSHAALAAESERAF